MFPLTAAQPPPMNRSAPNRAPPRAASSFRDSLAHRPVCRLGRAQIGHTPLMCAAIKGGRAAVVRELIKLGANVNKQDNVSRPSSAARRWAWLVSNSLSVSLGRAGWMDSAPPRRQRR